MSIKNREPIILNSNNLPLFLTERETSMLINVSVSALRKARCEGQIGQRTEMPRFVKIGGRVRYRTTDVMEWADSLPSRATI
jgi:predicted DNA-binding transcriptional regulator AlpA